MEDSYDPLVSLVYVPEDTAFSHYDGVIIGCVDVGEKLVSSRSEAERYGTLFRIVLSNQLANLQKFNFVELNCEAQPGPGMPENTLLFQGRVTKFDSGSGLKRYLSYFVFLFQSGATDFQVEGRFLEGRTGRVVLELADRRRHLCNTPFGPNPRTLDEGFAMGVTARETATCLARFVDTQYGALPATLNSERDPLEVACADGELDG
jgi:hypothetical protein